MSARPGDWGLVGYASDPLPGDVAEVDSQAKSYRDVAGEIDAQIARLKQIATGNDGQQGKYVDPLRDSATELSGELTKVQNRFDTVAAQLTTWATTLDDGRARSATILSDAEDAHTRVVQNAPPSQPLPDDASQADKDADDARGKRYDAATTDLQNCVDAMTDLMEGTKHPPGVNDVARDVAKAIKDAADDAVKDSWWDSHVKKWVHDHAHLIEVIVKVIAISAIVIAVAALICATGGFGLLALAGVSAEALASIAAVGSALETVGAVLGGTLLVGHAAEMNAGVGDVGWGTIALDIVGLATFGLGRLASSFASGTVRTATAAAKTSAAADATADLPSNVTNALKISSDTNPLKVWAAAQESSAVSDALGDVDRSLDVLGSLTRVQLAARILANGGTELAEQTGKLQVLGDYSPVARTLVSGALKLTHVQSVVAIGEGGKTIWEGTVKLPREIHELEGLLSGSEGSGGE